MRIESNRLNSLQSYQKWNQKAQDKVNKQDEKKDAVKISTQAKELLESAKTGPLEGLPSMSDLDGGSHLEKVEDLKSAISSGLYQVNSQKVADKLLSFWGGK